jgi:AraC-like DNA-binding protein
MPLPCIYNLEEFAQHNAIHDVYGASVGCFSSNASSLEQLVQPGLQPSFYSLVLMIDGWQEYMIGSYPLRVEMNDLFIALPYHTYRFSGCSKEVNSIHLIIEGNFFDDLVGQNESLKNTIQMDIFSTIPVFHLEETKTASFLQSFDSIRKTIGNPHLYKNEMIKYQLNICLLMLAELVSGHEVNTHDLKHKDNILKIFLHLASRHFRKERQIQFYADSMNVSTAYLSRTIKELTGNTVFGYLSNFLYNEICIQLKTTEKTISEIADDLNFGDQSALTNFFRSKTGMSPLAYRKKKTQD